jgi:hypothetical protein
MEKEVVLLIGLVCIGVACMLAVLNIQAKDKMTFDPQRDTCVERNGFFRPVPGISFSCYNAFVIDYPECCKAWVARDHVDRYDTCVDEAFFAYGLGIANDTSAFNVTFAKCLEFNRTEFTDRAALMAEIYRHRYNSSTTK